MSWQSGQEGEDAALVANVVGLVKRRHPNRFPSRVTLLVDEQKP